MEGNSALKAGKWSSWSPLWMCGTQLKGKITACRIKRSSQLLISGSTVGIVGLGNIGRAVMERLIPFGIKRVVYSGRSKKEINSSIAVDFVGFEELLQESDFVIVTCSYYPELKHLFNKVSTTKCPVNPSGQ